MILEPKKIKSDTVSTVSTSIFHEVMGPRLQQYVNRELPDVQAGFRKAKEPDIKLPTSVGS